jgi:hypothetical protein
MTSTFNTDINAMWEKIKRKINIIDAVVDTDNYNHTCTLCRNVLHVMEDGFPTCSSCGLMYRHILDYSPEWRFYSNGNNDRNVVDQTRCGNPINPLLKESSFGCTASER